MTSPHSAAHARDTDAADGSQWRPTKLFVGQVPAVGEAALQAVFQEFGTIEELLVVRDSVTGEHRGCAFVTYASDEEAQAAVRALHDVEQPLGRFQVRLADSQRGAAQQKLFVGMLPPRVVESDLRAAFGEFGEVVGAHVLRGPGGRSKGCAFVRFARAEDAAKAVTALHATTLTLADGGPPAGPIVVKVANARKRRGSASSSSSDGSSAGSVASAEAVPEPEQAEQAEAQPEPEQAEHEAPPLPQDNMPAHHDYYMPHMMMPMPGMPFFPAPYDAYAHAAAVAAASGTSPEQVFNQYAAAAGAAAAAALAAASATAAGSPQHSPQHRRRHVVGGTVNGPPGANLFIYHLPQCVDDHALTELFLAFGTVLSAKVFVDKETHTSRGFGFVSYDSFHAAEAAIGAMNGYAVGGKRLKVQHKREFLESPLYQAMRESKAAGGYAPAAPLYVAPPAMYMVPPHGYMAEPVVDAVAAKAGSSPAAAAPEADPVEEGPEGPEAEAPEAEVPVARRVA